MNISFKDQIKKLKNVPIPVIEQMLIEQSKQGNQKNIKEFQDCINCNKDWGGFDWEDAEEGFQFWSDVIIHQKHNKLCDKYPSKVFVQVDNNPKLKHDTAKYLHRFYHASSELYFENISCNDGGILIYINKNNIIEYADLTTGLESSWIKQGYTDITNDVIEWSELNKELSKKEIKNYNNDFVNKFSFKEKMNFFKTLLDVKKVTSKIIESEIGEPISYIIDEYEMEFSSIVENKETLEGKHYFKYNDNWFEMNVIFNK